MEHHISKFKAGGSLVNESDEKECRSAEYILTLGPAAILQAKKIVQSVVDADSASGKIQTYANVLNTNPTGPRLSCILVLDYIEYLFTLIDKS